MFLKLSSFMVFTFSVLTAHASDQCFANSDCQNGKQCEMTQSLCGFSKNKTCVINMCVDKNPPSEKKLTLNDIEKKKPQTSDNPFSGETAKK